MKHFPAMKCDLADLLAEFVPGLAKSLKGKFPTLELEDIESQCWLGILEHQDELDRLLDDPEDDPVQLKQDARQYATKAVLALRREQDRHYRAVRALRAGYQPEDQAYYSPGLLRNLLPAYLDNGVTDQPPKGREITPSNSDPAEGGNWLAMMIDVDYAFGKIAKSQRSLLARYFAYPQGSGGWTHLEIANAMGIPATVLEGRIKRALSAMERHLGGSDPRRAKHEDKSRGMPGIRAIDAGTRDARPVTHHYSTGG